MCWRKMNKSKLPQFPCQICHKSFPMKHLFPGSVVRASILTEIIKKHPDWDPSKYICSSDLDRFRIEHLSNMLKEEEGALSKLDEEVMASYKNNELITENINKQIKASRSFGERISDKFAGFLGSWTFIIIFGVFLLTWVSLNFLLLLNFDPFPFILLNLTLSSLAAFQAPIILMSQNRQNKRDRIKFDYEYMINLKAELEIQHINAKIDELMRDQWKRLVDLESIQIELMEEIKKKL